MQSRNPVLSRNAAFSPGGYATFQPAAVDQLETQYAAPPATGVETGRMTLDDVVTRTGILFGVLLVTSAVSWFAYSPILTFGGAIVAFVLALVISFKSSTNVPLIVSYAAFEGLFVGGISKALQSYVDVQGNGTNIVGQAVLGTLAAFTAMLVLYKTGVIKATKKFTKMLMIAGVGYLIISLVNLVSAFMGVGDGWGFRASGLGLLLCVAGVAIASLFLILDFAFIEQGIANGAPRRVAWLAAFGLMVTLVWIYLEILRLLAILNRR
jgi:uncharacterized YccA/Bax inhibitor family protein